MVGCNRGYSINCIQLAIISEMKNYCHCKMLKFNITMLINFIEKKNMQDKCLKI